MGIKPLAVVTGASTGIGFELARVCAQNNFDLVVAANEPQIDVAATSFEALGAAVVPVQVDLSTPAGVDKLVEAVGGRPVDALLANAGVGLGGAFLDQEFSEVQHVIGTNITGTLYLVQMIGRTMRNAGKGRILITGSIAGFAPVRSTRYTMPAKLSSILSPGRCVMN